MCESTSRTSTKTFAEADKRKRFVPILSPLKAGPTASAPQEAEAKPSLEETIPVHADLVFAASILPAGEERVWTVGAKDYGEDVVRNQEGRRVYVHLTMTGGSSGKSKITIDGNQELKEGDGCYLENLRVGDQIGVKSTGSADAEFVVLDSD